MKETILHNELGEPISTVLFIFFTENYWFKVCGEGLLIKMVSSLFFFLLVLLLSDHHFGICLSSFCLITFNLAWDFILITKKCCQNECLIYLGKRAHTFQWWIFPIECQQHIDFINSLMKSSDRITTILKHSVIVVLYA